MIIRWNAVIVCYFAIGAWGRRFESVRNFCSVAQLDRANSHTMPVAFIFLNTGGCRSMELLRLVIPKGASKRRLPRLALPKALLRLSRHFSLCCLRSLIDWKYKDGCRSRELLRSSHAVDIQLMLRSVVRRKRIWQDGQSSVPIEEGREPSSLLYAIGFIILCACSTVLFYYCSASAVSRDYFGSSLKAPDW